MVLETIHFPFIMEFYRTYKDKNNVYFLVEHIRGNYKLSKFYRNGII